MPTPPSGFDAFFSAITSSPEFRSSVTKDWKDTDMNALDTSMREMGDSVAKAADMMKSFDEKFANSPKDGTGDI